MFLSSHNSVKQNLGGASHPQTNIFLLDPDKWDLSWTGTLRLGQVFWQWLDHWVYEPVFGRYYALFNKSLHFGNISPIWEAVNVTGLKKMYRFIVSFLFHLICCEDDESAFTLFFVLQFLLHTLWYFIHSYIKTFSFIQEMGAMTFDFFVTCIHCFVFFSCCFFTGRGFSSSYCVRGGGNPGLITSPSHGHTTIQSPSHT